MANIVCHNCGEFISEKCIVCECCGIVVEDARQGVICVNYDDSFLNNVEMVSRRMGVRIQEIKHMVYDGSDIYLGESFNAILDKALYELRVYGYVWDIKDGFRSI